MIEVALDKDGKPTGETKLDAVKESKVLHSKEHSTHVVLVTIDSQKFWLGRRCSLIASRTT